MKRGLPKHYRTIEDKPAPIVQTRPAGDPVVCKLCVRDGVEPDRAPTFTADDDAYRKHLADAHPNR